MSIDDEEVQAKGIENIFDKIVPENFPNLKKQMVIQVYSRLLGFQIDKTTKEPLHVIL
jgi:hypothetical protein